MLTIENSHKIWRRDVGEWRIARIETQPQTYLFQLMKLNGERLQVNLERNPIGLQYELWIWNPIGGHSPHPNSVPNRRLLDRNKLITPDVLLEQIKELVR